MIPSVNDASSLVRNRKCAKFHFICVSRYRMLYCQRSESDDRNINYSRRAANFSYYMVHIMRLSKRGVGSQDCAVSNPKN